jgi:ABC-type transport system involved in cytochrome c biogenesis permease subunit
LWAEAIGKSFEAGEAKKSSMRAVSPEPFRLGGGNRMKKFAPWIISLVFVVWVVARMVPPKKGNGFDTGGFSRLPALVDGRIMPMDSLARISLSIIRGRQTYETTGGKRAPAIQWLLEVFMAPERADGLKVFHITNPDVLDLFGGTDRKDFAFSELSGFRDEIQKQSVLAEEAEPAVRNAFQREIIKLKDALLLYLRLKNSIQVEDSPDFGKEVAIFQQIIQPGMQALRDRDAGGGFDLKAFDSIVLFTQRYQTVAQARYVYAFPNPAVADPNDRWQHIGPALLSTIATRKISDPVSAYSQMISAYRNNDHIRFNQVLNEYSQYLSKNVPQELVRPRLEVLFNQSAPFVHAMVLYLAVFLITALSWLWWPKTLGKTAVILLVVAFLLHTIGLATRMYLQGRPPVTNLYSSAIFIGWASVLICLLLERLYRNGIGSVCAATIGFVTLLIAYNLQLDGDTLAMLRAVLDTNVWLATHVVTVTLGYSGTFLAGLLGIIYIVRGLFTRSFDENTSNSLGRMTYGVVCFATLFSLVGTILGGIWADQSWGRFWGWDPKENGALAIVLWNAIVLHARWGGYARERGIAVLAVFGNVVTSLSWFGVNMLGVGLHSYGFMDKAFGVLIGFIISQLVIIGLGFVPTKYWRGIRARNELTALDAQTPPAAAVAPLAGPKEFFGSGK